MTALAYFAQLGRNPGTLLISPFEQMLSFKPIIPKKDKKQVVDSDPLKEDGTIKSVDQAKITGEKGAASGAGSSGIDIRLSRIRGIKKRDTTKLLVVVTAGLEIEYGDGEVSYGFRHIQAKYIG
jgi:hypothetical protein